jgi:hypothetical protein
MNKNDHQNFASDGWYYQRLSFGRGRPGTVTLQEGKLSFTTAPAGTTTSSWYVNASGPEETIFETPVANIDGVSFMWVLGALKVVVGGDRHVVSFVPPAMRTGFQSLTALLGAEPTLTRWHELLSDVGGRPRMQPVAPHAGDTNGGASS